MLFGEPGSINYGIIVIWHTKITVSLYFTQGSSSGLVGYSLRSMSDVISD
jgi:hypothetical protein